MKEHPVRWTDTATDAIVRIASAIGIDSEVQAQKIADEIFRAGNSLALFPLRGRVVPELRSLGEEDLREIFHKPWRLIYEAATTGVEILLVIDGRRDCDEALRELLLKRRAPH